MFVQVICKTLILKEAWGWYEIEWRQTKISYNLLDLMEKIITEQVCHVQLGNASHIIVEHRGIRSVLHM